ncbi:uncharacterized protein LOC120781792 [Bactrocera tryoni]|uniref:uncharacterized protein LOC120781792 n=1 Tax=Bactrocera tryoni TaxID=59916 RepID=UPI001A97484A|nr:uncharacterized protein LOC120781792 [Bactrocera tryoni]
MFLNPGLRRQYSWNFIIADVSQAIIGADFLSHFKLAVNLRQRKLIDDVTNTSKLCSISTNKMVVSNLSYTKDYQPFHDLLREFEDITMDNKSTVKKPQHFVTHHIVTKGPPVFSKPRRLSPEKLEAAKAEIQLLLNAGICRPSCSPWASPLHMTKKKNGEWRPCGDFRRLNVVTEPDRNASQTFQRFMDHIFREYDFAWPYLDHILISSKDMNQHRHHLQLEFKKLREYGLVINRLKCTLDQPQVEFLGF